MSLTWHVNNELTPVYVVAGDEEKAKKWIGRQRDASRYVCIESTTAQRIEHSVVLVMTTLDPAVARLWRAFYPDARLVYV